MSHFSDKQAIEIWKKRWRKIPVQKLIEEYGGCNNWRFYEIFQELVNKGTRLIAEQEFFIEYPHLRGKVDTSPHVPKKRMVKLPGKPSSQGELFIGD